MIAGSCFYVKYLKYQALLFVPYNTRQRYHAGTCVPVQYFDTSSRKVF